MHDFRTQVLYLRESARLPLGIHRQLRNFYRTKQLQMRYVPLHVAHNGQPLGYHANWGNLLSVHWSMVMVELQ